MNKIVYILLSLFLFANTGITQISISTQKYNALKEIKKVPEEMTYDEFIKIQREINWKRIAVAAVIPGYLHYYADHKATAWSIFGIRLAGGILMGYAALDQYKLSKDVDLGIIIDSEEESNRTEKNTILFAAGFIINILAYAFDWAHGDWVIENERNAIYYKYGLDKEKRKTLSINYDVLRNAPLVTFRVEL